MPPLLVLLLILLVQVIGIILTVHYAGEIMATQAELAQGLVDLKTQLGKVSTEVQGKLQELADALANQGGVSAEVQAAFDDLKTAVGGLDDLIPDVPPVP